MKKTPEFAEKRHPDPTKDKVRATPYCYDQDALEERFAEGWKMCGEN